MHKHRLRAALASLALALPAGPARAWNDFGHMAVAYVAYEQLTPATRERANRLLALNPQRERWLERLPSGLSQEERERMLFMIAATWADQIKSLGDYTADGSANGNRPDGSSAAARNTGYSDHFMHKYWHFVDTPFAVDATPLPPVPTPNARTQIQAFRKVLSGKSADARKSYDLSWLLHLVGDVHQPLHCATRVSRRQPDGDAGGNGVSVQSECAQCPDNLHAFWDGALGALPREASPAAVIRFAKTLPLADPAAARELSVDVWLAESFAAAQQSVYSAPVGRGSGPFALSPAYRTQAKKLAMQRVALAGARLARLLNAELK